MGKESQTQAKVQCMRGTDNPILIQILIPHRMVAVTVSPWPLHPL